MGTVHSFPLIYDVEPDVISRLATMTSELFQITWAISLPVYIHGDRPYGTVSVVLVKRLVGQKGRMTCHDDHAVEHTYTAHPEASRDAMEHARWHVTREQ